MWAFLGAGVGLEVLAAVGLLVMFRSRGWLSSEGTGPPVKPAPRAPRVRLAPAHWLGLRAGGHHSGPTAGPKTP
jgi:hypothetical protein